MKLIAAMRVKNESWVIRYTLSALSEFVDGIVILDDGSTDDTVNICNSYDKVIEVVQNKNNRNENDVNEAKDWNIITKLAKKHGADWILYTDADEMLEPDFSLKVRSLIQNDSVGLYRFRKISPWKGIEFYRTDSNRFNAKAETTLNPILVNAKSPIRWDDGRGGVIKKIMKRIIRNERFTPSLGRGFPNGIQGAIVNNDELVSIHFNHIDMDRLHRKQVFYALIEKRMRPNRPRDEIVNWVAKGWNEDNINLVPIKSSWLWHKYLKFVEYK